MKRNQPRSGVRRIAKHDFLERVAAVYVVQRGAIANAGLKIHAGLKLVRAGARIAKPRGIGRNRHFVRGLIGDARHVVEDHSVPVPTSRPPERNTL